jgi:hypothetical protein
MAEQQRNTKPKVDSGECCSIDSEGNKDDTWLHEEMLDGDHTQAKRVSREWLRKQGWSDAEIALLMGN